LYLIGILVAWIAQPRREAEDTADQATLRLVVGAMVLDQAVGSHIRRHS